MPDKKKIEELSYRIRDAMLGLDKLSDFTTDDQKVQKQREALAAADKVLAETDQKTLDNETYAAVEKLREQLKKGADESRTVLADADAARVKIKAGAADGKELEEKAKKAGAALRTTLGTIKKDLAAAFTYVWTSLGLSGDVPAPEQDNTPEEPKKPFDFKNLIGGILGALLGFFLGKMFGGGTIGTIAGLGIGAAGFFMGQKFVKEKFGDSPNTPSNDNARATGNSPAKEKQVGAEQPAAAQEKTPAAFTPEQEAEIARLIRERRQALSYTPGTPAASGTLTPNVQRNSSDLNRRQVFRQDY